MQKHIIITGIACAILFGGIGYSIGLAHGKASVAALAQSGTGMRNGTYPNGARGVPGMNGSVAGTRGGMRGGEGFISGEVISKDDTSVTVKTRDGSTRIIFVSQTTEVTRPAKATIADLVLGSQIMAAGKQGTDGTVTATTIQVRQGPPPTPGAPKE